MKTAIATIVLALLFTGCAQPIRSSLDVSESTALGLPAVSYHSEKDVIFKKTSTAPDGTTIETVEFQALASAAAYAQAEREKATAEALKAALEKLPSVQ